MLQLSWRNGAGRFLRCLIPFVGLAALVGCTAVETPRRIVWPPPPQPPVFEFVGIRRCFESGGTGFLADMLRLVTGTPPICLEHPYGVAVDKSGRILISEMKGGSIISVDPDTRHAVKIPYTFASPHGIAIDSHNNIYVADTKRKEVMVISPEGVLLGSMGGADILERPVHLALDEANDKLYVSDARRHRISLFSLSGEHKGDYGSYGKAEGQFGMPHGITISRDRRVHVADMLNSRIQVFDEAGKYLSALANSQQSRLELEFPRDLGFTSDGHLQVIDMKRGVLTDCTPNGIANLTVGDDKPSSNPLGFSAPTAMHVDKNNRIYIVDQGNKRLSIWQYLPGNSGAIPPTLTGQMDLTPRHE